MLRPDNLTDLYVWNLIFEDGRIVNQENNNMLSKATHIDVNQPDESLGRPFLIMLMPRRAHLPVLHWKIPDGCLPFYAGANMMHGDQSIGFKYLVGYVEGRHRHYSEVDPETGVAEDVDDYDG